jgi:hypothetical protein
MSDLSLAMPVILLTTGALAVLLLFSKKREVFESVSARRRRRGRGGRPRLASDVARQAHIRCGRDVVVGTRRFHDARSIRRRRGDPLSLSRPC